MVSALHRAQVSVCLALIICLRLVGHSFFSRHQILRSFFEAPLNFLDETMKALVDASTPERFVEVFLDDVSNGLLFSRLPECLVVLRDVWQAWCRRNVLRPEVHAATLLLRARLGGAGQRMISTTSVYDCLQRVPTWIPWSEEEINRALQEEHDMRLEARSVVSHNDWTEEEVLRAIQDEEAMRCERLDCDMPVTAPASPDSVSAATDSRFRDMARNDGAVSPLNGDESPPRKRYKKWYHRQNWADSAVHGSLPEAVASVSAPASLSMAARAEVFQQHLSERRRLIDDLTAQAVPVHHPGQDKFKWGGCRDCPNLSLQPHLNRHGRLQPGRILLRCSSWFRRNGAETCWYSYPFPMALFPLLPRRMQEEYQSLEQSLRRGAEPAAS